MSSRARSAAAILSLAVFAAAATADSPQFRGPERDGVFPSRNLMKSWPDGGPELLWSATGLGQGFASVSVADGRVYTTGATDGRGSVLAFDTAGKPLWRREYGAVHDGNGYPGTRTTPTFDEGLLYVMSSLGKAAAFEATSGEIRWERNLPSRNITWGITESPLVVDDRAIFTPGGDDGTMVALDKKTGTVEWSMTALDEASAYCSPRLYDHGRHRQIITMTQGHMIGVDPTSGELLWKQAYSGRYGIHAVSPVFHGSSIYVSDGYKQGGKLFDLASDGRSVSLAWEESDLDVHHGGTVLVQGIIYGAASNGSWYAIDAGTGEVKGTIRRLGKGSLIYADGLLYGYTEKGEVLLVDPDPDNFAVISRLEITQGRGQHWAHPVIANGVLYIRHGDVLMAFHVSAN
jgi:outer membrane protein assembly factor BamB